PGGQIFLDSIPHKTPRAKLTSSQTDQLGFFDGDYEIPKDIQARRGQEQFRKILIQTYHHCLITGCEAKDALEAAHIRPYKDEIEGQKLPNGLLLRADIHTLFDLYKIAIEPERLSVIVHKDIEISYGKYHNSVLLCPPKTAEFICRPLLK